MNVLMLVSVYDTCASKLSSDMCYDFFNCVLSRSMVQVMRQGLDILQLNSQYNKTLRPHLPVRVE